MKALTKWLAGAATAAILLAAAPASAQYYDYRYDRYRDRDTVDAVVDGVARVAGAVAAVTQGGYYDPRYGYGNRYGYNQYGYARNDRFAADACGYEAQRRLGRRYGGVGVNIVDVRPYRYDRVRVYGTADLGGAYGGYGHDRYGSHNRGRIGIECTVRLDGRVTDFDTNRYAYGYR
jgi:hypothetical protein